MVLKVLLSNVQDVNNFLVNTSFSKHTQNLRQKTTLENWVSKDAMHRPYCKRCFYWNGVFWALALHVRFAAGLEQCAMYQSWKLHQIIKTDSVQFIRVQIQSIPSELKIVANDQNKCSVIHRSLDSVQFIGVEYCSKWYGSIRSPGQNLMDCKTKNNICWVYAGNARNAMQFWVILRCLRGLGGYIKSMVDLIDTIPSSVEVSEWPQRWFHKPARLFLYMSQDFFVFAFCSKD